MNLLYLFIYFSFHYGFLFLLLGVSMFLTVWLRKLTMTGALIGGCIGFSVFAGAGYTGICLLGLFFILGTMATSWKMHVKEDKGFAEKNKGRRTAGQVLANGGTAGLMGLLAWFYPHQTNLFCLMLAASLSSATADTLSSELGVVYGRRFFHILTFREDLKGLDGVISLEGTLFGLAGSVLIALVYFIGFGWSLNVLWIIIAGTFGNLTDSVLGATLERHHLLSNNAVNFLNTALAAIAAFLLTLLFQS